MTLPDAEDLFAGFLKGRTAVTAVAKASNVRSAQEGKPRGVPAITVRRFGGAPIWHDEDAPQLRVEVWASTDEAARSLARVVEAQLPSIRGPYPDQAGYCTVALTTRGPEIEPDPDSNQNRAVLEVELRTYPL